MVEGPVSAARERRAWAVALACALGIGAVGCEGDALEADVSDADAAEARSEDAARDDALDDTARVEVDLPEVEAPEVDAPDVDAPPTNLDERCEAIAGATRFLLDERWLVAAIVALVDEGGTAYCAFGTLDGTPAGARPDARTQWEIGSVTKVVTAILLAHLAADGVVALEAPVASYLPEGVRVPSAHGVDITLTHLSTHRSGLPRMPTNFAPSDPGDPFADYTIDDLYAFLGAYALPRDPGAAFEYSNLGVALLGHALERAAGLGWWALAEQRVLLPMGMDDTVVVLDDAQRARLAPPFDVDAEPGRTWDLGIFVAAGGLRSTASDMARFVRVTAGIESAGAATDAAIAESQRERYPGIGLGWGIGPEVLGHSGQTGGYHSALFVDRAQPGGIVALGNTGNEGLEHLAAVAFAVRRGAPPPEPTLRRLGVPPEDLSPYVGTYARGDYRADIALRDGGLDYYERGQGPFRMWPSGGERFHLRVAPVELEFVRDAGTGEVTTLRVHQPGAVSDVPRAGR